MREKTGGRFRAETGTQHGDNAWERPQEHPMSVATLNVPSSVIESSVIELALHLLLCDE